MITLVTLRSKLGIAFALRPRALFPTSSSCLIRWSMKFHYRVGALGHLLKDSFSLLLYFWDLGFTAMFSDAVDSSFLQDSALPFFRIFLLRSLASGLWIFRMFLSKLGSWGIHSLETLDGPALCVEDHDLHKWCACCKKGNLHWIVVFELSNLSDQFIRGFIHFSSRLTLDSTFIFAA